MKISLSILLFMLFSIASAQETLINYMPMLPQIQSINPARYDSSKNYISLPVISRIDLHFNTIGFNLSKLNNSLNSTIDPAEQWNILAESFDESNEITINSNLSLLGLGFHIKKSFVSLDITQRTIGKIKFPNTIGDLRYIDWAIDAPGGKIASTSNVSLNSISYNEFRLGYAFQLSPKIRLGIGVKYLVGVAFVRSNDLVLDFDFDEYSGGYLQTSGSMEIAGPFSYYYHCDNTLSYTELDSNSPLELLFTKNNGLAFDFGIQFSLSEKINLSAAVSDLGYINWRTDPVKFTTSETFLFINSEEDSNSTIDGFVNDTLTHFFRLDNEVSAFKSKFRGNYNVQVDVQVAKWLYLGTNWQSTSMLEERLNTYSLGARITRGKNSSLIVSYTISNPYANSLSFGLVGNLWKIQLYALFDGINRKLLSQDDTYYSMRYGLNLRF